MSDEGQCVHCRTRIVLHAQSIVVGALQIFNVIIGVVSDRPSRWLSTFLNRRVPKPASDPSKMIKNSLSGSAIEQMQGLVLSSRDTVLALVIVARRGDVLARFYVLIKNSGRLERILAM